jgi:hypothetical protein
MLINKLACTTTRDVRILSADVVWEDRDFPAQEVTFEIDNPMDEPAEPGAGGHWLPASDGPCPDAFLAACFPLAALHRETRVRIEGRACPMLVEGLRTAFAWWSSWGGMPAKPPEIETVVSGPRAAANGPRHAVALVSGGVDSLHLLMRNRQLYHPDDSAYIRDAIFIHGFDIGKRARDPENERYRSALQRLEPVAAEIGVRIVPFRTNLRHLPSKSGFWANRHSGAALAAVGHAAILGAGFLFIGGTYHVATPRPGRFASRGRRAAVEPARDCHSRWFALLPSSKGAGSRSLANCARRVARLPGKPRRQSQLRALRKMLAHSPRIAGRRCR